MGVWESAGVYMRLGECIYRKTQEFTGGIGWIRRYVDVWDSTGVCDGAYGGMRV